MKMLWNHIFMSENVMNRSRAVEERALLSLVVMASSRGIPAPIAYIKVVVVKKLVVGSGQWLEAVNFVVVLLCRRSADCWRFRGALNRVSLDASSRVL